MPGKPRLISAVNFFTVVDQHLLHDIRRELRRIDLRSSVMDVTLLSTLDTGSRRLRLAPQSCEGTARRLFSKDVMKYLIILLSSLVLTSILWAASLRLAFCGDWTVAWWCMLAQRWLVVIAWPIRVAGLWFFCLFYVSVFFFCSWGLCANSGFRETQPDRKNHRIKIRWLR
jgi:hypothetical protein